MIDYSQQAPSLHKKTHIGLSIFFLLIAGLFSVIWAKEIKLRVLPAKTFVGNTGSAPLTKNNLEQKMTHVRSLNPISMHELYKHSNANLLFSKEKELGAFSQNSWRNLRAIWNKSSHLNNTSEAQVKHKFNTID